MNSISPAAELTADRVSLRPTQTSDLPFVLKAERHPDNVCFVGQWSQERHESAIATPHEAHFLVTAGSRPVGYTILQDLTSDAAAIRLRRLVITDKGQGYGHSALQLIQQWAFLELQAHRLWLDVKTYNPRARHLYAKAGFVHEGCLRDCIKTAEGYLSLNIMAILKPEFTARYKTGTH